MSTWRVESWQSPSTQLRGFHCLHVHRLRNESIVFCLSEERQAMWRTGSHSEILKPPSIAADALCPKPLLHWLSLPVGNTGLYSRHQRPSHWGNSVEKLWKNLGSKRVVGSHAQQQAPGGFLSFSQSQGGLVIPEAPSHVAVFIYLFGRFFFFAYHSIFIVIYKM